MTLDELVEILLELDDIDLAEELIDEFQRASMERPGDGIIPQNRPVEPAAMHKLYEDALVEEITSEDPARVAEEVKWARDLVASGVLPDYTLIRALNRASRHHNYTSSFVQQVKRLGSSIPAPWTPF